MSRLFTLYQPNLPARSRAEVRLPPNLVPQGWSGIMHQRSGAIRLIGPNRERVSIQYDGEQLAAVMFFRGDNETHGGRDAFFAFARFAAIQRGLPAYVLLDALTPTGGDFAMSLRERVPPQITPVADRSGYWRVNVANVIAAYAAANRP